MGPKIRDDPTTKNNGTSVTTINYSYLPRLRMEKTALFQLSSKQNDRRCHFFFTALYLSNRIVVIEVITRMHRRTAVTTTSTTSFPTSESDNNPSEGTTSRRQGPTSCCSSSSSSSRRRRVRQRRLPSWFRPSSWKSISHQGHDDENDDYDSSIDVQPVLMSFTKRKRSSSRPSTRRSSCLFWCAMCFLSFCSALFCVDIVNTIFFTSFAPKEALARRQRQRQEYWQERQRKDGRQPHPVSPGTARLVDINQLKPPRQQQQQQQQQQLQQLQLQLPEQQAHAWEEAAAFGMVDDGRDKGVNVGGIKEDGMVTDDRDQQQQQQQLYSNIIQARQQDRTERRREYDRQRQNQRKQIRRSKVAKRVVGGVFYDPTAADGSTSVKQQSSWISWCWNLFGLGWMSNNHRRYQQDYDNDESVFDSGDLPVENFHEYYQARIVGWERDGIFWDYSLPAIPDSQYTLASPQPRASKLVVLVLSARHQLKQRQTIRETWGKGHVVYFVVGGRVQTTIDGTDVTEEASLDSYLHQEADNYKDVLDTIHPESYRSLPYKLRFAYQWVTREIPEAEWILKVDDDMVARIGTLEEAILNKFNPDQPFVMGKIVTKSKVSRFGKWAEYLYPHMY